MPVTVTSSKSSIVCTEDPPSYYRSTVLPFAIVKILVEVSNDRVWLSVSVNIPEKSTVLLPEILNCVPAKDSD